MTVGDLGVPRVSLEDRAADKIREEIISGRFVPGERLTEIGLAKLIGLSRGTIRGALNQLTREGLVVLFPYRGWAVQMLTSKDAWELYTLRNSLESLAARLVAETITPEKAALIHQAFNSMKQAVEQENRHKTITADFNLHRQIVDLTGHDRLMQNYDIIRQQMLLFFTFGSAFLDFKDYVDYHAPLVEAITSGDAAVAEQLSSIHNTVDGEALVGKLKAAELKQPDDELGDLLRKRPA